jgi:hypothetical protein
MDCAPSGEVLAEGLLASGLEQALRIRVPAKARDSKGVLSFIGLWVNAFYAVSALPFDRAEIYLSQCISIIFTNDYEIGMTSSELLLHYKNIIL